MKKTHKLTTAVIMLCVLLPALALVFLYPRMEDVLLERREELKQELELMKLQEDSNEAREDGIEWELQDNFINYAVEAVYYMYGQTSLQNFADGVIYLDILEEYNWVDDYYIMNDQSIFYGESTSGNEKESSYYSNANEPLKAILKNILLASDDTARQVSSSSAEIAESSAVNETSVSGIGGQTASSASEETSGATGNAAAWSGESLETCEKKLQEQGYLGYLILEYNANGVLKRAEFNGFGKVVYNARLYEQGNASTVQFKNNAEYFIENNDLYETDFSIYSPSSFRAIFAIDESCAMLMSHAQEMNLEAVYDYYMQPEQIYLEMGALWIVLIFAVIVAVIALLLPFIKWLHTGWEKLFSLPVEIITVIGCCGFSGAYGMFIFMCYTNMFSVEQFISSYGPLEILGYQLTAKMCYAGLLTLNFIGWALCFFMEYIVVAAIRQFLCGPVTYLKKRFLIVMLLRAIIKKCKSMYKSFVNNFINIEITEKLNSSIIKIVIINFLGLFILCIFAILCVPRLFSYISFALFWILLLYSVGIFIILRKTGQKMQAQYFDILDATRKMADGDLKIVLEKELGIFQPLGNELERVQQGFSKAVAEEAKSQNMKTELITNVSHDLKTPLTAIITYIELLKKEDLTEEQRKSYIGTLDIKSQRLKALIEDLFEVSKANSGNIQMNFMDVDVVSLMKQVHLELEDKISQSDVEFRWNLPGEKIILSLDGQRTYRIFENLLINILKYSAPHTRAYVDITDREEDVLVMFRNISAAELDFDPERLTARFVRGDSSRNSEGSGLGLAIVKSFVELQYGTLKIGMDGDLFKVMITWPKSFAEVKEDIFEDM